MPDSGDMMSMARQTDDMIRQLTSISQQGFDNIVNTINSLARICESGFSALKQNLGATSKAVGGAAGGNLVTDIVGAIQKGWQAVPGFAALANFKVFDLMPGAIKDFVNAMGMMRLNVEGIMADRRRFEMFNPQIMMSYMQTDLHQMMRQFQMAGGVADTTSGLVQSIDRMRQAWLGWDTFLANQQNRFAQFGADFMTIMGNAATSFGTFLQTQFPGLTHGRIMDQILESVDPTKAGSIAEGLVDLVGSILPEGWGAAIKDFLAPGGGAAAAVHAPVAPGMMMDPGALGVLNLAGWQGFNFFP
jgi:hypothetical protein